MVIVTRILIIAGVAIAISAEQLIPAAGGLVIAIVGVILINGEK